MNRLFSILGILVLVLVTGIASIMTLGSYVPGAALGLILGLGYAWYLEASDKK